MKKQPINSNSGALSRIIKATLTIGLLPALVLLFNIQSSRAESATWNLNPDGDWFTASNWTPATVPNGPADTATFDVSNGTAVYIDAYAGEVNGIVFNPGASAFTIVNYGAGFTLSGAGITNNSGITQTFENTSLFIEDSQWISFTNSATAGRLTAFINSGGICDIPGAFTAFYNTSSAGSGTFTNLGDSGHCTDQGGGRTYFFDNSTAGNGTFVNNLGYYDGGATEFFGDSSGGTARVKVFGIDYPFANGNLNISGHNQPGVTIGSIEGSGRVFLGSNNLTVGSNNLSTTVSGVIDGIGGSLTKIGTGTLSLTGANTYTGDTIINAGKLVVSNKSGSGTGSGPVQVNKGTLRGRGTIAGAVTLGTGSGSGPVLSPGEGRARPHTLTIQSTLTFNSNATYNFGLNSRTGIADQVVANGVTITNGAIFSFAEFGNGVLSPGTVFTAIENTAGTPITGTFINLADGSTLVGGSNIYQVSYQGGDGNDLTLMVQ